MRRRALALGLLAAPLAAASIPRPPWRVAAAAHLADQRFDFPLRLLERLLEAAGLPSQLQPLPQPNQREAARQLAAGELDIALLPSVGVQESGLLPLRWPVRRGLLGARLLLARRELLPRLAALPSVEALKRDFVMGYGSDWHDLPQLRTLGFRLFTEPDYPSLFRQLADGRFDYLSRGVNEVWGELDHPLLVPHGIAVVPRLALAYPLDDYFYVAERRRDWLSPLQRGFTRLWDSGDYQRLFFEHHGRALERATFARRRVWPLLGYGVEPHTPLSLFDALRLRPQQARWGRGA